MPLWKCIVFDIKTKCCWNIAPSSLIVSCCSTERCLLVLLERAAHTTVWQFSHACNNYHRLLLSSALRIASLRLIKSSLTALSFLRIRSKNCHQASASIGVSLVTAFVTPHPDSVIAMHTVIAAIIFFMVSIPPLVSARLHGAAPGAGHPLHLRSPR